MPDFTHCPYCTTKLQITFDYYQCPGCGKTIYKHSALTASIYPIKNGKVLLSVRGIEPFKGQADAIGGFLKYGEHPEKGVTREAQEETGLKIKPIHLLGVFMDQYTYQGITRKTLNFFYVGQIISGQLQAKDDVGKLFWQPLTKLPNNMAFKCCRDSYTSLQKWYNNNRRGIV